MIDRPMTLKRQTVTAAVTEELRRQILSGERTEGEQLRQDAIAERFNVSRIPVREALRQLEAEGLVVFFPHRGAVVSALSIAEIRELFDIRRLLECDLLRHAIPHMSEADFAVAQAVLDAYAAAIAAHDVASYGALNWRFHHALYAAAARPRTLAIVETVNNNVDRYLRTQLTLKGEQDIALHDHSALLEMCRDGRAGEAVALLADHIRNGGESLIAYLEAQRAEAS